MDRKVFTVLTVLFMVFVGLQLASPVSAAKLVDNYSMSKYDKYTNSWYKTTWKAYQYYKNGKLNNNFVKIYRTGYVKHSKSKKYVAEDTDILIIAKISKSTVKITWIFDSKKDISYEKTGLTAARYYWRVFRPEFDV